MVYTDWFKEIMHPYIIYPFAIYIFPPHPPPNSINSLIDPPAVQYVLHTPSLSREETIQRSHERLQHRNERPRRFLNLGIFVFDRLGDKVTNRTRDVLEHLIPAPCPNRTRALESDDANRGGRSTGVEKKGVVEGFEDGRRCGRGGKRGEGRGEDGRRFSTESWDDGRLGNEGRKELREVFVRPEG